jgi:hypothetical protein
MNPLITALLLLGFCLAVLMGLSSALLKLKPQSAADAVAVRHQGPAFRNPQCRAQWRPTSV